MQRFSSAEAFLKAHRPVDPVRCLRPFLAERAAQWFQTQFPGRLLYAVKANPTRTLIEGLSVSGVSGFDVASLHEIEHMRAVAVDADLFYMNPVKSRAHIREAYFTHGVRRFAVDSEAEVLKILDVTNQADDLCLFVRLACNDEGSVLPLGAKYGVSGAEAAALLQLVRAKARRLGVTFHVGSQALVPARYGQALTLVGDLVRRAGVVADVLNVGGGFPIFYKEGDPLCLEPFLAAIRAGLADVPLAGDADIFAEPGRALVAESESLIVRVDGRRDQDLFINDGGYGVLYDAAFSEWVFPCRLIGSSTGGDLLPFSFWGPTCDAADRMKGPFYLPASVKEGDYIEIYKTGAYGWAMASVFNGFGSYEMIELEDDVPLSNFASPLAAQPVSSLNKAG